MKKNQRRLKVIIVQLIIHIMSLRNIQRNFCLENMEYILDQQVFIPFLIQIIVF